MQKGTVLNFRSFNKILLFLRNNNILLMLTVFFIVGLFIGVFTYGDNSFTASWAESFISGFTEKRTDSGFLKIITHSFFSSLLFVVFLFFGGTSVSGVIVTPLLVTLRGFLYSNVSSYLYGEYGLKGIAFHTVIIIPSAVFAVIALILCANESVNFSLVLARLTLPSTAPLNLSYDFKKYCLRYLSICSLILLSALIDAIISVNLLVNFTL